MHFARWRLLYPYAIKKAQSNLLCAFLKSIVWRLIYGSPVKTFVSARGK